jgi:hypothetical protein
MDEREITAIERHEDVLSLKHAVGAMYKVYYKMGASKYELMLYARDELHAYQKFKDIVRESAVGGPLDPFGAEQSIKRKRKKG